MCLGEKVGLFLLVWLHCLLAVFGMRGLARALQVGRWQGYFMAFSYVGGGGLTHCWADGTFPYCCALCYVPWLFYCAMRTTGPWMARRLAVYALLLALQFICGNPQVFWFSAIGQIVFILGRAVRLPAREAIKSVCRSVGQFGVACLWSVGLVAVVLLPFLELVHQGNRVEASPAFTDSFRLTWQDLETLASPVGLLAGPGQATHNLFVGPIVLLLGLAGLCLVREANVRGLIAVGVVALLLALGNSTPCFWLFYKWLPGYSGFRCHEREGLLVVLVLICAAGIWLSRPHPQLRAMWDYNFDIPARWVLVGMLLLQALGLVYATSVIKRISAYPAFSNMDRTLAVQLREAGLMEPSQPPPRVCVPWSLVPANYGMIYRYSNFDANWSLFLRRPWEYLHAELGIQPPELVNTSCSAEVYNHGPFPYRDLGLAAGVEVVTGTLQMATNPAPRAFLVYATEVVGDYSPVLKRLTNGHDIHRSALLEKPLAEPLPQESVLPGATALIRRFEPNWLLVEVEAKTNALLVLAEAWYPGWRAEIDGRSCDCVPANLWMRAMPVPAGRHQVRVYFHQNYLLPGLLVSLASAGLLLLVLAWPK